MKTPFADALTAAIRGYRDLASTDLTAASMRLFETVPFFLQETGTSTTCPVAALRPSTAGFGAFREAVAGLVAMRRMWLRTRGKASKRPENWLEFEPIAGGSHKGPGDSPDRADAMVWALTELVLRVRGVPRVRAL